MIADYLEYLRRREADELAAADEAACMARTAHEDLADEYADRAEALSRDAAQADATLQNLITKIT